MNDNDKNKEKITISLSAQEREVVLDVLKVEKLDLHLDQNNNADALEYGKIIDHLEKKLETA